MPTSKRMLYLFILLRTSYSQHNKICKTKRRRTLKIISHRAIIFNLHDLIFHHLSIQRRNSFAYKWPTNFTLYFTVTQAHTHARTYTHTVSPMHMNTHTYARIYSQATVAALKVFERLAGISVDFYQDKWVCESECLQVQCKPPMSTQGRGLLTILAMDWMLQNWIWMPRDDLPSGIID